MEWIRISADTIEKCASRAAEVLRGGGIIVYPTDTLYGLGADAFSDAAVDAIYAIKGRDPGKPIHAVVADIAMMEEYAIVNDDARLLAEAFVPGALTLVLRKREGVERGIARGIETIGFRIPDNALCAALARDFGAPYTTTSANRAGASSLYSLDAIFEQLAEVAEKIDIAFDAGVLPARQPSTVVDCSGEVPRILRDGAIAAEEIRSVLEG